MVHASATPSIVGVVSLVVVCEDVMVGETGATVSIVKDKVLDSADIFPEASVAVTDRL